MGYKERSPGVEAVNSIVRAIKWRVRLVAGRLRRPRLVSTYLAGHDIRKLQIGAGPTRLAGWLSTDISPKHKDLAQLDATRRFPFADASFDYVYSEHMIEHIGWHEGMFMLGECWRVLKPGGRIRIATPDLQAMTSLLSSNDEIAERYIRWVTDNFLKEGTPYAAPFVINNVFYNWGHRFIYDAPLLQRSLEEAGFTDVTSCRYGESDSEHLRGLEAHGENAGDNQMAVFETMVYEGQKPAQ